MRVILQFLSRRWLGASVWVYVLAFAMAAWMYWLLPTSSLIHRWELSGAYQIEGFSRVDNNVLIISPLKNRDERLQLDTVTGKMNRRAATDEESHQVISSQELPYQLLYLQLSRYFGDSPAKLSLKNKRDGSERNISCNDCDIQVAYIYAGNSGSTGATVSLSTSGLVAISSNERWLILLSSKVQGWVSLKNWLIDKTGWSLSFLPNDFKYKAFIFDLQTDKMTTSDLSAKHDPEFIIHPDNTGYAVHDLYRNFASSPDPAGEETIISWYSLPPGPSYHTRNQWLLILAMFLTPILLAMCLHLIRRRRPATISSASK